MSDKLLKRLMKRIGIERSTELLVKVFEEASIGAYDEEFRATITGAEAILMDKYATDYAGFLLQSAAEKLSSLRCGG